MFFVKHNFIAFSIFVLKAKVYARAFALSTNIYWANEILICTPALVLVTGAEVDIYGITLF